MAYTIPSVLVYQQLANAGGVANVTPDLPGVIVGPCYNVVRFDTSTTGTLERSFSGIFDEVGSSAGGTVDYTLPAQEVGQIVQAEDLDDIEVWLRNAYAMSYNNGGATIVVSGVTNDSILPVASDPTVLTSGGEPSAEVGDEIHITGDIGATYVSTIVEVTSTTIRVADSISANIADGSTTLTIMVLKNIGSYKVLSADVDTSTTTVDDIVTLSVFPSSPNGDIMKADVHIQYRALRLDLGGRIQDVADIDAAETMFGDLTDMNPVGLGVQLALANTTTGIRCVTIDNLNLAGYQSALELLEGTDEAYALVPLTQDQAIINTFATHAVQMSVPEEGAWRIALVNTAIPTEEEIGPSGGYTSGVVADEGTYFTVTVTGATFLDDDVRPGDAVNLTDVAGAGAIDGTYAVDEVFNNTTIKFADPGPSAISANVTIAITRTLTKSEQAARVASVSSGFNSNRVAHIQPDSVGVQIEGATKYLPGYYLCAGLAGAVAGFPVQQGLTNISLAGFSDLEHSNFYFTRTQMNAMAEDGTMLFAQLTQDSAPYCRHELMTDMSVLQYRELLKVKNLDFLSYYFRNQLSSFIGTWNITEDTLNIMRQTIIAAAELLKGQRLPRIGPPLISYTLARLEQDPNNKDQVIIELEVATADPNNYTNLYLIV